jgi:hypothetical protein
MPRPLFDQSIGRRYIIESYQSFWVDNESDQASMFVKFCESLAAHLNASLFHFGSYEIRAFKEMKNCIGGGYSSLVDRILSSSVNVLSVLHHHFYFPTYSNRLKEVARFLGYRFDGKINSGVRSIVFRERWEESKDHFLKDTLTAYNRQDCEALRTICEFVRKIATSTREGISVPGAEVVNAESLRKVGEGNRPIFRKAEFLCPEFEVVNKCAYFDYQRDRVFARTQRLPRRPSSRRAKNTERRISLATELFELPNKCRICGSKKLVYESKFVRWKIDLKFYKTGIGVKKWQPRYLVSKHRCLKCNEAFISPGTPFVANSRAKYGHGLMCWCIYHHIIGRQSMLGAHTGDRDHPFQRIATNCSDRSRPGRRGCGQHRWAMVVMSVPCGLVKDGERRSL